MTEIQICESYRFYATHEYPPDWSISVLSGAANLPETDIIAILNKYGLAQKYGLSENGKEKEMNKPKKQRCTPPETVKKIIELGTTGLSQKAIAEQLNIGETTVQRYLAIAKKKSATETATEEKEKNSNNVILPQTPKNVKPRVDFGSAVSRLEIVESVVEMISEECGFDDVSIVTKYANNLTGITEIVFNADGVEHAVKIERTE